MRCHLRTQALLALTVGLFALLTGARGLSVRSAHASDESLAILGVESIEVGDALGMQITEALRKHAAETTGVRLVPGKDLIELKMIFGCDGEAPACLAPAST